MAINLTQHLATPEQLVAGVVDLPSEMRDSLAEMLTFAELPTSAEIKDRAAGIASLAAFFAESCAPAKLQAMIGGAPYLMAPLERELVQRGIEPVYAFSVRASIEQAQADGSVRKVNVFRHAGFVPAA